MESYADKSLYFVDEPGHVAPLPDPREAKYQLAERLVDNIRLGEAIRILEALGDYGNSLALLSQVRVLKACQDAEDSRLRAERRRQAQDRAEREARDAKRRRVFCVIAAAVCLVAFLLIK